MEDKHSETSLLVRYPSPEELFAPVKKEEPVFSGKLRAIPTYAFKRSYTGLFFLLLIIVAFLLANLDNYGIKFYYMRSSSMESEIPKGSFLVVGKFPSASLDVGDVITFKTEDGVSVTHKITEVIASRMEEGAPSYTTKGTENKSPDSEQVSYESVDGKVLFHIPYLGKPFMWLQDKL